MNSNVEKSLWAFVDSPRDKGLISSDLIAMGGVAWTHHVDPIHYSRGRPAGLRTYSVVCISFATIALLSETFFRAAGEIFRADPARLAAGGLTGIGFLGAGVIIRHRSDVFGLTTAASIWTIAVIGLALGARHYILACTLDVIALAALWLLRYLEPIESTTV